MVHPPPPHPLLPVSWEECRKRGWNHIDVLLVTGDAYVDHPSFGIGIIARLLEHHGYQVCILSQPRYDSTVDFSKFPPPRLFCGISAGNLDSIVANYTGNGKIRDSDAYSCDGNPYRGDIRIKTERRRPDRASLIYTSLARAAFRGVPVVLGGVEASLRRFVHFDYKQARLRSSFLTDAKADLLVYGMGEKAVIEIARRCSTGESLSGIPGTCERLTDSELQERFPDGARENSRRYLVLPSWNSIGRDKRLFLDAEMEIDRYLRAYSARKVLQRQQSHWVLQHPPPIPLSTAEMDEIYALPFSRLPNPPDMNIPACTMIRDSVTIVRGCSGNCSFCSITRHQGPAVTSRSVESILAECKTMAQNETFSGTISDLGGPTANLFGTSCRIGSCKKRDCLYPEPCHHLLIDEELFLRLLKEVSTIRNVRNVFISSGLRMELLLKTPELLKTIIRHHTPGALKIAPEHTDDAVLKLMHKEPHELLQRFVNECRRLSRKITGKDLVLTPYVISSHPGSTEESALKMARDMRNLGLTVKKFQDFTPTPGSLSTAMYVTGLSHINREPIAVARNASQRLRQRKMIEDYFHRKNTGKGKKTRGRKR
jgi:uncharacterized radical SAM protein YgiQ